MTTIWSPLRHVTHKIGQLLPRRGMAIKPPSPTTKYSTVPRRDPVIRKSLQYMGMQPSFGKGGSIRLPPTPSNLHKAILVKVGMGRYIANPYDACISSGTIRSESVIQLERAYERRMTEPLWIDVNSHHRVDGTKLVRAIVKSKSKRKIKHAIIAGLARRGIHQHGWDLAAYQAFWKADAEKGGTGSPMPSDDSWPPLIQRRLQGTVFVLIQNPFEVASATSEDLKTVADVIVENMLISMTEAGPLKPNLPPPRSRLKPWMAPQKPPRGFEQHE